MRATREAPFALMDPQPRNYAHNIPAARNLRKPQTGTEELLWSLLRDRRFQSLKFRRQHAVGRFVLDFYCHELRLAVEVDGGVHSDPERRRLDYERQEELEAKGIRFHRVAARDVEERLDDVLAKLQMVVDSLSA